MILETYPRGKSTHWHVSDPTISYSFCLCADRPWHLVEGFYGWHALRLVCVFLVWCLPLPLSCYLQYPHRSISPLHLQTLQQPYFTPLVCCPLCFSQSPNNPLHQTSFWQSLHHPHQSYLQPHSWSVIPQSACIPLCFHSIRALFNWAHLVHLWSLILRPIWLPSPDQIIFTAWDCVHSHMHVHGTKCNAFPIQSGVRHISQARYSGALCREGLRMREGLEGICSVFHAPLFK